jgi:hypothetical protein
VLSFAIIPLHLSSPINPKFPTTTLLLMHIDVTNVVATKSRQKRPKKKKKIQKIWAPKNYQLRSLFGAFIYTLNWQVAILIVTKLIWRPPARRVGPDNWRRDWGMMLMVCEKHYSGRPIPRRQRDDKTWRVAPTIGTIPRDSALVLSSFLPALLPAKNIPSFFPQLLGPKSSFLLHPNLHFLSHPL